MTGDDGFFKLLNHLEVLTCTMPTLANVGSAAGTQKDPWIHESVNVRTAL